MKALLFLTVLSAGIVSANDWRTEENLDKAKPLAMNYFWKQPRSVSGQDVVDAVEKFTGEVFFSWQDDRGFTFMHVLACETDNTALFGYVLALGNSLQHNKKGNSPRNYPNCRPAMKQIIKDYDNETWTSKFEDAPSYLSEEALLEEQATQQTLDEKSVQQRTLLVCLIMFGIACYGWHNHTSDSRTTVTV